VSAAQTAVATSHAVGAPNTTARTFIASLPAHT
jgi:hypothetical protein